MVGGHQRPVSRVDVEVKMTGNQRRVTRSTRQLGSAMTGPNTGGIPRVMAGGSRSSRSGRSPRSPGPGRGDHPHVIDGLHHKPYRHTTLVGRLHPEPGCRHWRSQTTRFRPSTPRPSRGLDATVAPATTAPERLPSPRERLQPTATPRRAATLTAASPSRSPPGRISGCRSLAERHPPARPAPTGTSVIVALGRAVAGPHCTCAPGRRAGRG
jgi:hypothetical protein